MKLTKCEQCGGPTAEGLALLPDCMRATGGGGGPNRRGGRNCGTLHGPVHHSGHRREHS